MGRVHTIGKGLLLAEIQQSSDVTYRIYDFDRTDDEGNKRELHTEQALEALDYKSYSEYKTKYLRCPNEVVPLVESAYFTTNLLEYSTGIIREHYHHNSFVIYTCFEGEAEIHVSGCNTKICMGNAIFSTTKVYRSSYSFKIWLQNVGNFHANLHLMYGWKKEYEAIFGHVS